MSRSKGHKVTSSNVTSSTEIIIYVSRLKLNVCSPGFRIQSKMTSYRQGGFRSISLGAIPLPTFFFHLLPTLFPPKVSDVTRNLSLGGFSPIPSLCLSLFFLSPFLFPSLTPSFPSFPIPPHFCGVRSRESSYKRGSGGTSISCCWFTVHVWMQPSQSVDVR